MRRNLIFNIFEKEILSLEEFSRVHRLENQPIITSFASGNFIILRMTWWTRWTLTSTSTPACLWCPFQNKPLKYHKDQFEVSENSWNLCCPFTIFGIFLAKINFYHRFISVMIIRVTEFRGSWKINIYWSIYYVKYILGNFLISQSCIMAKSLFPQAYFENIDDLKTSLWII